MLKPVKPFKPSLAAVFSLLFIFTAVGRLESRELRIGYVNMRALYDESAVTQRFSRAYLRQKDEIITGRDTLRREVDEHVNALKTERSYLKRADFQDRLREIQKKIDELNEIITKTNKQLEDLENEMKLEIFLDISEAIESIAREKGFDLIINKKTAVLYGDSALDITDDVLDVLTEIDQRDHPNAK